MTLFASKFKKNYSKLLKTSQFVNHKNGLDC